MSTVYNLTKDVQGLPELVDYFCLCIILSVNQLYFHAEVLNYSLSSRKETHSPQR